MSNSDYNLSWALTCQRTRTNSTRQKTFTMFCVPIGVVGSLRVKPMTKSSFSVVRGRQFLNVPLQSQFRSSDSRPRAGALTGPPVALERT